MAAICNANACLYSLVSHLSSFSLFVWSFCRLFLSVSWDSENDDDNVFYSRMRPVSASVVRAQLPSDAEKKEKELESSLSSCQDVSVVTPVFLLLSDTFFEWMRARTNKSIVCVPSIEGTYLVLSLGLMLLFLLMVPFNGSFLLISNDHSVVESVKEKHLLEPAINWLWADSVISRANCFIANHSPQRVPNVVDDGKIHFLWLFLYKKQRNINNLFFWICCDLFSLLGVDPQLPPSLVRLFCMSLSVIITKSANASVCTATFIFSCDTTSKSSPQWNSIDWDKWGKQMSSIERHFWTCLLTLLI